MKLFKKILFVGIALMSFSIGYSWNQIPYDCSVADQDKDNFLERFSDIDNEILQEDEISLAYDHLESYCCEEDILWDDCNLLPPEYPESPYFYDHIVDIGFRKLDWNEELLYSQISSHEDGIQRREKINELAEQKDTVAPWIIYNTFRQHWNIWGGWWLYRKYQLVCIEAEKIQRKIFSIVSDDASIYQLTNACMDLVQDRVNREITYVRSLYTSRWDDLMQTNLRNYLDKYFARNRAIDFLEKMVYFEALLMQVTKKVNEWTPQCSPW